jgi:hypothetical protein
VKKRWLFTRFVTALSIPSYRRTRRPFRGQCTTPFRLPFVIQAPRTGIHITAVLRQMGHSFNWAEQSAHPLRWPHGTAACARPRRLGFGKADDARRLAAEGRLGSGMPARVEAGVGERHRGYLGRAASLCLHHRSATCAQGLAPGRGC